MRIRWEQFKTMVRNEPVIVRSALVSIFVALAGFIEDVWDIPLEGSAEQLAKTLFLIVTWAVGSGVVKTPISMREQVTPVWDKPQYQEHDYGD